MPVDKPAVPFTVATAVRSIDSHSYEIDLQDDWCIGSVPHGGYVTSCFMQVAKKHFETTLCQQNQPHTMTLHMEFPRRTETGPARFAVKDVKLGRQTSTVHITLTQHDREEVVAYLNQSNLTAASGVSFPTDWELHPSLDPVDLARLKRGQDPNWAEQRYVPFASFRRASHRVRFFFPRRGQKLKSVSDQWLCFRNGERFTTESLGYVADMFPQVVEAFNADEDPYQISEERTKAGVNRALAKFWYPTVVLNLDIKKALPEEGVEWLFARSSSKQIHDGRLDIEVVIMDEHGELVALSHHVTLVLGAERNLAKRTRNGNGSNGGSKM